VGRLLGADRVIFAETSVKQAEGYSPTGYNISVSVRCINLENAEIRWAGTAISSMPVVDPEPGLILYTKAAIEHAVCPVEKGYEWREYGPQGGGCKKRAAP